MRTLRGLPPVCVLGDVDLVRALGLAGLSSVVVAARDDPVRFSRHTVATLHRSDHWTEVDALLETLLAWARTQPEPPVLLPQTDGDLLAVSRHRDLLGSSFRFLLPPADLVEDLLDKARFQRLAEDLGLPVPPGRTLPATGGPQAAAGLRFPLVVKPLSRRDLVRMDEHGKALLVPDEAALRLLWPRLAGVDVLVQELVPGPETRIESWHAYVDADGEIAGEFCGRKVRTWPPTFGHSTALEVTDVADVRRAGREVADRLGVRGLVKVDFKRGPAGELHLLEVNPRATLWLHPGAVAGVNLAELLHADLTSRRRPVCLLRPGVTWCTPREDRWAARALGVPRPLWWWQLLRCPARSGAAWGDPAPLVRGHVVPLLRRRLAARQTAGE